MDPKRNKAIVEFSVGFAAGATSASLITGDGAKLPPTSEGAYNLAVWDDTAYPSAPWQDPNFEIVRVTTLSGDSISAMTRAQEGTSDVNHNTGGHIYKALIGWTKKDRDDVESALNARPQHIVIRKSADESVANSTTLQNDDHLSFAIGANETWAFEFVLFYDGDAAGDLLCDITFPSGATNLYGVLGAPYDASSITGNITVYTGSSIQAIFGTVGAGTKMNASLRGTVANGGNAGNVTLRWAQYGSNATPTRIFAGSYLVATRIG